MLNASVPANVLDTVTAATSLFHGDAHLSIDQSGLEMRIVSQARHAMVDISLSTAAFESYEAAPMQTSLDTDVVANFISVIKRPTDVAISIDADEQTLTLETDFISYTGALIDSRYVPPPFEITDVEQPAEFVVSGQCMNLPLELANLCGSELTTGMDDNNGVITGLTDDFVDRSYFELGSDEASIVRSAGVESTYSLNLLVDIQRTIPDETTVRVALDEDGPITFEYPIADENGTITFTHRTRV